MPDQPRPLPPRRLTLAALLGPRRQPQNSTGRGPSRAKPHTVKVGSMICDAIEVTPETMVPLEVRTGAHKTAPHNPNDDSATLVLRNPEDGHLYTIIVRPHRRPSKRSEQ